MRQIAFLTVVLVLFLPPRLAAQGLFESAVAGNTDPTGESGQSGVDLGGYVKGYVYAGKNSDGDARIAAAGAQLSLKLTAEKPKLGKAHAELRIDAGATDGDATFQPDLREAWVAAYPGPVDIRLGKQIVAWGRADGINPTNNVTPMNNLAYSPELDDTRMGPDCCYTAPFNASGAPAVSLPLGWSSTGLPIGVQLVGRDADEATLIRLAAQLEQARPWAARRPPLVA